VSFKPKLGSISTFSIFAGLLFESEASIPFGFCFFAASFTSFPRFWEVFDASSAVDTTFFGRPLFFTGSADMLAEWNIRISELCL